MKGKRRNVARTPLQRLLSRRSAPLVVATVASEEEAWRGLGLGAEAIELRIDLMRSPARAEHLLERLRETGVPRIATHRPRREGGRWSGPEAKRLELLARCAPRADGVDLELSAAPGAGVVRRSVRDHGAALLLSHHDFRTTPPEPRLRARFGSMLRQGADIAKVAVTARRAGDLHRLYGALMATSKMLAPRKFLVGVAMGPAGLPSRVMAGLFGSALTYGYVDRPRAPGQVRVDRLRRMVETLYGTP